MEAYDVDVLLELPLKVKVGGKEYEIPQMKTKAFIALREVEKQIADASSIDEQYEGQVALVHALSADVIPRDVLLDLTPGQLNGLAERLTAHHNKAAKEGNAGGAAVN